MRKLQILLAAILILAVMVTPSMAQEETIADVASGNEDFSTLMLAVAAADPAVAAALSDPEQELTVFAPTNEAFEATLGELGLTPDAVLGNQELLTQILLYHVVPTVAMAEDVVGLDGQSVTTLSGEDVTVRLVGEDVTVENATVVATDVEAANGVIHVIDRVIVPPTVLQALVADATDLGTEDNPITLLFIPSENADEVQAGADQLVTLLSEATGFAIEANVATDYSAAIEAMCNNEAEIAALNTFGYILASERGCADVGVVSVRFGSTTYGGQVITRNDSGIESLDDITEETIFCRPDPLSTSGWIIPSITMAAAGIDVEALNVVDSGGHDAVVAGVYGGECEAGATFVDARGNIEDENPDVRDVVVVIQESLPIPNDTLSFSAEVPAAMKILMVEALLDVAGDAENAEVLNTVYSWDGLQRAADAFYDDFREQLDAAGVDVETLQ